MKKSIITLYSGQLDIHSQIVRIILAEKGVGFENVIVDANNPPAEILELNPYNIFPTLVDRDLTLYGTSIIAEYLDERFPHPPLLPVYPVARAKTRLTIHRIEQDWLKLIAQIQNPAKDKGESARKNLGEHLFSLNPVFAEMPYFLSEEFSLIDCYLAPLLWRLPNLGVKMPSQAKAINAYAQKMFDRVSFKHSLSELEKELHEG